ncbi:glucose 1-dehydrogenase [Maricurvus nonylphenolicus]|uniref:SDR family NAD(P)-dependent oxidoreductase n=1 Tax=Maricurvus nonylphenolicus TaxID=1008307 RepID=UPI0036F32D84
MDPLLNYTDKVVLITGAASGFGKLLAKEFADRGAKLVLGDINEAGLDEVVMGLQQSDKPAAGQRCDVSKEADIKGLVDLAKSTYGRLDIAINNAGVAQEFTPIAQTSEELLDLQLNINTKSVLFGMKHQIPLMQEQGEGVILNVSSMAGLGGSPKIGAYSAAKHAVVGLTKTAAVECGRKNIRINAVCPFFTLTPMVTDSELTQHAPVEDVTNFLSQGSPMKRLGEPEEIVNVMLLLCSPGNTYMTGQTIAIDGGVSAF